MSDRYDRIADFVPGGMGPDTYHLRLPWGAVLVIAAEDGEDRGLDYYATDEDYQNGTPTNSMAFRRNPLTQGE